MIMSRRDWQLQQLGITQLILKRPAVFQSKITISIPEHIRLVIIAEEPFALNDIFINDVLRTLKLNHDQVLHLIPKHASMLTRSIRCDSWQIGVVLETFLKGNSIISPTLSELKNDPVARSKLWRQICKFEHNSL